MTIGYLFMRVMSWELGHFITHLFGISFGNSWKLVNRPLVFPMVQIFSDFIWMQCMHMRLQITFKQIPDHNFKLFCAYIHTSLDKDNEMSYIDVQI